MNVEKGKRKLKKKRIMDEGKEVYRYWNKWRNVEEYCEVRLACKMEEIIEFRLNDINKERIKMMLKLILYFIVLR